VTTHLGQNPLDHVVLEIVGGMNGGYGPEKLDFVRNGPDGTRVSAPSPGSFRVPVGKLLVITDVDWQYAHGTPGDMQIFRLFADPLSSSSPPGSGLRVFESAIVLGPQGSGGASIAMTSGFTISSKARIGADVFPGPTGLGGLQHVLLRGYLTIAPKPVRPPRPARSSVAATRRARGRAKK
jgi:hypothetical protein